MTETFMIGILVGTCVGLLIVAILAMGLAYFAYTKVVGFENSTHKIEYHNPFAGQANTSIDDTAEKMRKAFGYEENERDHI